MKQSSQIASAIWLAQPPLTRLQQAGLIAVLSGNFSLAEIIEIGDALLAAPVLALEIDRANRHACEAITDLSQRAGPHLLIGVGGVQTVAQAGHALTAGAQFTTTDHFDPVLVAHSQKNQYLHVPTISTLIEAQQAAAAGCPLVKVEGPPECLADFCQTLPELAFIAAGNITAANIAAYAQSGAMSVAVDRTLITEPYTSMAAVISTARALQRAWAEAQSRRGEA